MLRRNPVGKVRASACTRSYFELTSAATRVGSTELIVLRAVAGTVLRANTALSLSFPDGTIGAVRISREQRIVGVQGARESGDTDASARGADDKVARQRKNEGYAKTINEMKMIKMA